MDIHIQSLSQCPCSSGNTYQDCCQRLHQGALPKNALELMRSRYCAYANHFVDYIIRTTHPENDSFQIDKETWAKLILNFSENTEFVKLEIIEFIDGPKEAYVTFIAHLKQNLKPVQLREKSYFIKVDSQWLYRQPV